MMRTPFFVPMILFLSLQSNWAVSGAVRCHPEDKKALLKIKNALGNPYVLSSWNTQIIEDCCHWCCLHCDVHTQRITRLYITNSNLTTPIPPSVAELPYLDTLSFHKLPNLIGTIPQTITSLTHLTSLDVSWTNISGPIPDFLTRIKTLRDLDLSFNNLTGPIPSSLAQHPNLSYLNLHGNKLTGSIPDSFNLSNLAFLFLSNNQLTGNVPKSLGDAKLYRLDLSRNNLQGDISFFFDKKELRSLDFSRNMFQFDLSNIVINENISSIDLSHNKIYGSLPQSLTNPMSQLGLLNVSYNRLCGQIPVGGILQRLDTTAYFHNRCLCGAPLPPCKL